MYECRCGNSSKQFLIKEQNEWLTFLPKNFSPLSDLVAAAHLRSSFILEMVFVLSPLALSFFSVLGHCLLPFTDAEDWAAAWSLLIGRTLVDPKCAPESDLWLGLNPRERFSLFMFIDLTKCCLLRRLPSLFRCRVL